MLDAENWEIVNTIGAAYKSDKSIERWTFGSRDLNFSDDWKVDDENNSSSSAKERMEATLREREVIAARFRETCRAIQIVATRLATTSRLPTLRVLGIITRAELLKIILILLQGDRSGSKTMPHLLNQKITR